jgi:hypothetical protein
MNSRSVIKRIGLGVYHFLSLGMRTEYPFSRFGLYHSIQEASRELKLQGPILSISHSRHLLPIIGVSEIDVTDANFPEVNILNLPHPDGTFNLVISDQVFEHIQGLPSDAMRETLRVTKSGGWVLHTTCFRTPYHGPGDYWRYTPEGLGELAAICGADKVISSGAGSLFDAVFGLLGWSRLLVPSASWHPLNKLASLYRPSYASLVWVLARKK